MLAAAHLVSSLVVGSRDKKGAARLPLLRCCSLPRCHRRPHPPPRRRCTALRCSADARTRMETARLWWGRRRQGQLRDKARVSLLPHTGASSAPMANEKGRGLRRAPSPASTRHQQSRAGMGEASRRYSTAAGLSRASRRSPQPPTLPVARATGILRAAAAARRAASSSSRREPPRRAASSSSPPHAGPPPSGAVAALRRASSSSRREPRRRATSSSSRREPRRACACIAAAPYCPRLSPMRDWLGFVEMIVGVGVEGLRSSDLQCTSHQ
jgi:hypothetical protein